MNLTKEQLAGQHGECATVKVVADNEQGHAIINEHDFVKGEHELYTEDKPKAEAKPAASKGKKDTAPATEGKNPWAEGESK